jgi:glucose-1-phosphate adenylyltransferase
MGCGAIIAGMSNPALALPMSPEQKQILEACVRAPSSPQYIVLRSRVENSIVGVRSFIGADCELRDTIIMGCDFYETHHEMLEEDEMGIPHMSIGRDSKIERAIIDKNVHIGEGVIISDKTGAADFDSPNYYIRDGIVVIPKNAVISAGTRI